MLTDLVVEGLGVIDRAELSLDPGCSALTGETGAGKTLVVAALSLLLGGRADRTLVRSGAAEARVEGRFVVAADHPVIEVLASHGVADPPLGDGDVEVIVVRSIASDGRAGRVRVNGRLATVGLLAEAGPLLAEIAGQHEHQRFGAPAVQRELLDSFAGATGLAAETAEAVRAAQEARRRLEELAAGERERRRELDVLRYEISEIEAVAPEEGESAKLTAEAGRLEHAEQIASTLDAAIVALHGEGGAGDLLARARDDLRAAAQRDPGSAGLAERLEDVMIEVVDVADEARARLVAPDPAGLEEIRARLDALARLMRKYGDDEAAVLTYLEKARARVAEIEGAEFDLERSAAEVERLERDASEAAGRLSAERRAAAPDLAARAEDLLGRLAMAGARVEVALEERALYEGGLETAEIRLAADPGEVPRPVAKVASGGELSRLALAFHLLGRAGSASTMVFDEVDAGVGGAAAQAVGRALARLAAASAAQVIVVTHLPQVAAFAEHHFVVRKEASGGRAIAQVKRLEGEERVAELSRMLSGLPESDRAREHAQELLELAGERG